MRNTLLLLVALSMVTTAALAQDGQIVGTVVDAETGESLPGVNVLLVGTTQGSATDMDGNYEITGVAPGIYTVRASFVGYTSQEEPDVVVGEGETVTVDFTLSPGIALQEMVVIGYGEQRRRDLTGSVASVSGESIADVASPSVTQAMQGKIAGVQVTPSSGEPGEGAIIRIRGVGTLNDASPLFVVDGMLVDDIGFLNASDIQSVEVLKDVGAFDRVPVIGLAKRLEEVYRPGDSDPVFIAKDSPALQLLQKVRDEAHRFVIGAQRAKRTKQISQNPLDAIEGVGAARKKALLHHFGSAKGVSRAKTNDLMAVEGISESLAQRIYDHFHPQG